MHKIDWWKVASVALMAASAVLSFGHDLIEDKKTEEDLQDMVQEESNLNKVKENDIYVRLQFLRTNGQPDGKSAGRSGHQHGTCAVCYSTIRVDAADQTGGIHLVLYPDRA